MGLAGRYQNKKEYGRSIEALQAQVTSLRPAKRKRVPLDANVTFAKMWEVDKALEENPKRPKVSKSAEEEPVEISDAETERGDCIVVE